MSNPIILHPIFADCQDYTLDRFWKDVFLNCAQNKFPRGARYDPKTHTLYVRINTTANKTKTHSIELPQDSKELFKIFMNTLKEKLNIYSTKDLQIKKEELEEIQKTRKLNLDCEWKKLKPRSIKEYFILNYITKLRKKYNLNIQETKNLSTTIHLAFQFKKLSSTDVEYQNGEILNITGLEYDEKARMWNTTNITKYVSKNEKSQAKQKFYQATDRFVKEYKSRKLQF